MGKKKGLSFSDQRRLRVFAGQVNNIELQFRTDYYCGGEKLGITIITDNNRWIVRAIGHESMC